MPACVQIVPYKDCYAEPLSAFICRNFLEVNSRDYPLEEIQRLCSLHTPAFVRHLMAKGQGWVALSQGEPVGCTGLIPSLDEGEGVYSLRTVFVSPSYHGLGIGRALVERAEEEAWARGAKTLILSSSITARGFYEKLGYRSPQSSPRPDAQGLYRLEKEI